MKILLAVDGSPYTKKMLAYLGAHDELLGGGRNSFTVLTVMPAMPPRARAVLSKEMLDEYYNDEAAKVLEPVRKYLEQGGIMPTLQQEIGPAGETIARVAEEGKYDLVIMGTHGHGALGRLVMGSVSTQVLANCSVPVLLIR